MSSTRSLPFASASTFATRFERLIAPSCTASYEISEPAIPNDPTICAASDVAYERSEPGPVPVSPIPTSSATSPPSAIAIADSISDFVRVNFSSMSPWARRPSEPRRLMIDRTSIRRSLPRKYATVA